VKSLHTVAVPISPSRFAIAGFTIAATATAVLIALLPVPLAWRLLGCALLAVHAGVTLWRLARRRALHTVIGLEVGDDLRGAIIELGGRRIEGTITAQSYVGPNFASVLLRPDGRRLSLAIPVFADMLPADDFRRLRVLLRLARPATRQPLPLSHRAPSKVPPLSAFD
jgi:hypothetical protein